MLDMMKFLSLIFDNFAFEIVSYNDLVRKYSFVYSFISCYNNLFNIFFVELLYKTTKHYEKVKEITRNK